LVGGTILALVFAGALLAPSLAPYDPRLPSGAPFSPPSSAHPLGTNDLGQDLFSQWLWGGRASLRVAVFVALLSTALSWTVGIIAGLWQRAEGPLMALTDLFLALPALPLYLLVVTLVGASQQHVALTLGLLSWPAFARIVRAQSITLRSRPYVEAARSLGATPLRLARVHLLPGTMPLLPAKLILTVRFALFAEATLAFLGLGDPAATSWGTMLSWAFRDPLLFSRDAWLWWTGPPALSIALVVLATTWLASDLDWHGAARYPKGRACDRPLSQTPHQHRLLH
jgi:ABC-type dipeptide/oligopeptide/nickel transport system permease subunit